MGGTPKNPEVVEGWLRSKTGVTDAEEVQSMVRRTMIEQGTWRTDMTQDEIDAATKLVAQSRETTGFKIDENGLYIEQRQVKAAIKESTSILFPGERWGATRRTNAKGENVAAYQGKAPRSFVAERVFVSPEHISLGRFQPDDVELVIGHIIGPQGPRSTLGYHQYVLRPELTFDVLVMRDCVEDQHWYDIWTHMEENGLGALRSQGYGTFDLTHFERVDLLAEAPAQNSRVAARAR